MSASPSSSVFFISGINHCELQFGHHLTIDHLRALQHQLAEQHAERARALQQLQQQVQGVRPAAALPVKAEPGLKKEEDGTQQQAAQSQQQLQYAALLALQLQQQQAARAAAAVVAAAQQQQQQQAAVAAGPGRGRGGGGRGGGRGQHARQQKQAKEEDEEPAVDQWVQCSKCQQWRQVPDEFWPDISNADEDEDWLCKDALWDVEDYEPHTPACC